MNINEIPSAQVIPLAGGQLYFLPEWLDSASADELYTQLLQVVGWRQDVIKIYGKEHPLPRLQAWYGDSQCSYRYSGMTLSPQPWLPELKGIRNQLQEQTAQRFNAVLVNLYRDGRDSNGWHADNEPELGERPVIASISLGETRRFRLRSVDDKTKTLTLDLPHGSLILMGAGIQEHWQHQITKTARKVGPRINLTYRQVY
ncbi:alpha-ketoglutarate-dependent dioxygenase AlkB family protein [Parendozoicomonas haliclonae]|uniref:Fe2OG dioxygenase domain-containing protein n=1 Tax=Parendozoicomonas haliclonae TaxID=1960125 RepID=A0A1X7AR21_9GAMM|nr:alpha-ketoglutarate-dependent dioxygenase AlkB [Parendozoicomonas haliclonae]SMA50538.1 hypothetical protein EHSB41UT_04349 [Parendozoicomonas haliclonae]